MEKKTEENKKNSNNLIIISIFLILNATFGFSIENIRVVIYSKGDLVTESQKRQNAIDIRALKRSILFSTNGKIVPEISEKLFKLSPITVTDSTDTLPMPVDSGVKKVKRPWYNNWVFWVAASSFVGSATYLLANEISKNKTQIEQTKLKIEF